METNETTITFMSEIGNKASNFKEITIKGNIEL
jgi:hypothetical protein